jgi:hypothetical protein
VTLVLTESGFFAFFFFFFFFLSQLTRLCSHSRQVRDQLRKLLAKQEKNADEATRTNSTLLRDMTQLCTTCVAVLMCFSTDT